MNANELETMLAILQKYGVRRYVTGELTLEFGADPIASGPAAPDQSEEERRRANMKAREELLYASSEGMP